jgi:putative cell wall-binding protein
MIALLVPVVPAGAAPLAVWVSPVGSDSTGTGAETAPYRTITRALDDTTNGDTIYALPGTYDVAAGETFPLDLSDGESVIGIGPGPAKIVGDGLHTVIYASDPGGMVYTVAASITLRGLDVSGSGGTGDASGGGGIVMALLGTGDVVTIEHCRIHDNNTGPGGGGGGVMATCGPGGSVVLRYLTIEDNQSDASGGGVYFGGNNTGSIDIHNCIIRRNACNGASSTGGGMYLHRAASLSVDQCEVTENTAANFGGGISSSFAALGTITNSLIAENSAKQEAGVWLANGTVGVYGCTLAGNVNTTPGGWSVYSAVGTYMMRSCIAWGNSPADMTGFTYSHSCLEDATQTGPGVIYTDPQFVAPDAESSNFRLLKTSPCIDAGVDGFNLGADLDGWPRPVSGDGLIADAGCYESGGGGAIRIAGANRYSTASAAWADPYVLEKAYSAVVASGEDFPDALSASALAGAVRGPLLLTRKASLSPEVTQRLSALGVTGVYLIGGESAVSAAVETQLVSAGYHVVRIAGGDRYATAALVANEVRSVKGTDAGDILIARGDTFPDALAASPWAYAAAAPILLTKPGSVPPQTHDFIASSAADTDVFVLGSESAIAVSVFDAIDGIATVGATVRIGGANRYDTAARIASYAVGDKDVVNWQRPALATGTGFADALAGGAAAGARRSALLLTAPSSLPSYTATAISSRSAEIQKLLVLGGTSAVTDSVKNSAASLIE